jgi:hypothetical protein
VFAPPAVKTELAPEHIVDGDAEAVTVGVGLTVTVTVAVLVQPSAVVPVTVYVVVEVGLIVFVAPAPKDPPHSNVVPVISELAVSSVLSPKQISTGYADAVIVGNG